MGWILDPITSLWKNINEFSHNVTQNLSNQWNTASASGVIRTTVKQTDVELSPSVNSGTGADGAGSVGAATTNTLDTQSILSPARSCADAVNYSVATGGLVSPNAAILTTSPAAGCLNPGDEVLLINLEGTTTAYGNVGRYETLRVSSVSTNTVNFTTSKTNYYGDNATDDSNIGTANGTQRIMLQRVPNYTTVTVAAGGGVLTTTAFNGSKGGVIFFRATGAVSISGSLTGTALGYRGGPGNPSTGGESFCGTNGGGGGGHRPGTAPTAALCGGGGGGGGSSLAGGAGTATGGAGGGGGDNPSGGFNPGAGGGGGGYGSGAIGGGGGTSGAGGNGGAGTSGNGGTGTDDPGGGGGGGTYGDTTLSTKLMFGSGGGSGGNGTNNPAFDPGTAGGIGGGIVAVNAGSITVSGTITSTGGASAADTNGRGGTGGGGAGGSVKLMAGTLTLGAALVSAGGGTAAVGASHNGGNGGNGIISTFYTTSYTGTITTPSGTFTVQPYYPYGLYHSPAIATPNSATLDSLRWEATPSAYGNIEFQTRTGNTSDPTDGSWSVWTPNVNGTNYQNLLTNDNSSSWTGTGATVSNNAAGITRNVTMFEDEKEPTATNITKIVNTALGTGYAEATVNNGNLSNYDYLTAWVYATASGSTIRLGFGEAAATEQTQNVTIDAASTWQKVYWDISKIPTTSRDAVTVIRITNLNNPWNTFYIDQVRAEKLMSVSSGTPITATPSGYLQYRAVFSTTNTAYQPQLNNVTLVYNDGFKIVQADANNTRLYNYSGSTQNLKLDVTGAAFTNLANPWTDAGSYLYPTGYKSLRVYDGAGSNYLSIGNTGTLAQLGWNGTAALNINSSGQVGIGTTSPGSTLDVRQDQNALTRIMLQNQISNTGAYVEQGFNTPDSAAYIDLFSGNYTTSGSAIADSLRIIASSSTSNGINIVTNTTAPIGFWTSATQRMVLDSSGNVGIGTTVPGALLDVSSNSTSTASAWIRNTSTTAATVGLNISMSASPIGNTTRFINFLNGSGTIIGKVWGGSATTAVFVPNGTDMAEFFTKDNPNATFATGTVMCQGPSGALACTPSTSSKMLGVVSDSAGFLGGIEGDDKVVIGLIGQLPVLVSPTSADIQPGDLITAGENGLAVKLTGQGFAIGRAEGSWTAGSGLPTVRIALANTWADPSLAITNSGDLNITSTASGDYALVNNTDNSVIDKVGAFGQLVAANIKAGAVIASKITTDGFTAFQGTIDHLLVSSGLVAGNIQTKLISPLADGTDVTIQVGSSATPSGKFAVQNSTGAEVASIDNAGNATFSGTLYADAIKSKSLDDIKSLLSQVQTDQQLLSQVSGWNINTATNSASINSLATTDLYVTNQAAVNSLSVTNSLTLGSDLVLGSAGNNIDTLSAPLKIQSLAMAPLEIMAGLVTIDTKGNVNIAGDLFVAGRIKSSGLTLTDTQPTATDSAKLLTIINQGGQEVSSVNASGSAQFGSVSTPQLVIAGADATMSGTIVNGVITTNSTIGQAIIPAGVSEITIRNPKVTDYTLVYVTPTSSTANYVLYVKSKQLGQFIVGFTNPIGIDVNFNWWIVQVVQ